jgi:hypothetical protein
MHRPIRVLGVSLLCLMPLFLSGCGGLNYEKSFDEVSIAKAIDLTFDAPRSDQKVSVTVTATKPVLAYLYTKDNATEVENAAGSHEGPRKNLLLGSNEKESKEVQFEATVPAKKEFKLFVVARERTDAKVKVQGR